MINSKTAGSSSSSSSLQTNIVTYDQIDPIAVNGTIETIRQHDPVSSVLYDESTPVSIISANIGHV